MRQLEPANNWDWNEVLQNEIAYHLKVLVWMKTKDGQRKSPRNQPKLFKPGFMIRSEKKRAAINKESVAQTTDQIKALLSRSRK